MAPNACLIDIERWLSNTRAPTRELDARQAVPA
jgi:hypothetical protein